MQNELSSNMKQWVLWLFNEHNASHVAIAKAINLPVHQVVAATAQPERMSNAEEELRHALLNNNDELSLFWSLYCESWRQNETGLPLVTAFFHSSKMETTFDAFVRLRDYMLSGEASTHSCEQCGRITIRIPNLVDSTMVCHCAH